MSEKDRLLADLVRRQQSAERLVAELTEARRLSEQILSETNGRDKFKEVTGNSSIENAIESARKMAETLARQIEQFKVIADPRIWKRVHPSRRRRELIELSLRHAKCRSGDGGGADRDAHCGSRIRLGLAVADKQMGSDGAPATASP